ncbi:MAG: LysE family transporter [Rhizobiales bacterium]|nr:LysE family transporter [Hyphomicrobiales bacterium]
MDPALLVIGIAIGIAVAAPMGPVNLVAIRSVLRRGHLGGVAAGAGAVLADVLLAAIAAYGIRSISDFIVSWAREVSFAGGVLLIAVGIRMARSHVTAEALKESRLPANKSAFGRKAATTFMLTITNPGSLFGFLAIFGAMSAVLKLHEDVWRPPVAVLGVAIGGVVWWLVLAALIEKLRGRLTHTVLDRINKWAGILVAAFGFVLVFQALG